MPPSPTFENLSMAIAALVGLWLVREIMAMRDLVRDTHAKVTDDDYGLAALSHTVDALGSRVDRHSERLRALDGGGSA